MSYKGTERIKCVYLELFDPVNEEETTPRGRCKFHDVDLCKTTYCWDSNTLFCYTPPNPENEELL